MEKLKRSELIQKLKDMNIRGCTRLKKERLIELINNPPSPPPPPSPEVIKEIERASLPKLKQKMKEMGLRGYNNMNKKELVELIKNPPRASRGRKIKRKVSLIDEKGVKLIFPTISQTAKYFDINPGSIGVKLTTKSEKARNSITIAGKTYQLHIE